MSYDRSFPAKVFPMLADSFDTFLSSVYNGRMYVGVGPINPTFPFCVFQSQDKGGKRDDYLNQNGWRGFITFRSIDTTLSGAWNKLIETLDLLPNVTASGYSIAYVVDRPMWFPVEKISSATIYTAAAVVEFYVTNI